MCSTRLKQIGIGLSLDDFGTGYSSLVLSDALPLRHDQDRQELRRRYHAEARRCCCKSMINMAHELGLSVVAEGVSDENDALQLSQMGCEYVQSFMFGTPMSRRRRAEDC